MIKQISVLLVLLNLLFISCEEDFKFVTCGSVIKLANQDIDIRLHSHSVNYGSGSGQQSVTGTKRKEDVNSYWSIKGLPDNFCLRGEKIKCGQKLRLEHLETNKNLHSHLFRSPLSGNQEISAFGKEGEGDTGDYWTLTCDDEYWTKDTLIKFKHIDTSVWLSASGRVYERPISGQYEIVGSSYPDSASFWKVAEGIYITSAENKENNTHDEL